jgi:hypothetical protein
VGLLYRNDKAAAVFNLLKRGLKKYSKRWRTIQEAVFARRHLRKSRVKCATHYMQKTNGTEQEK